MSDLGKLARASAAVEIGRRHPYLVLGFRVLVRFVLPLAVLVGAGFLAVYGWRQVDVSVSLSPWWLAVVPVTLGALYGLWAVGQRLDVWWRLRMALRLR